MTRLYYALAWIYRALLYLAVPYILWLKYGLTLTQLLLVLVSIFYIDTVAEAFGWYIYREDEYSPLPGAYALYMFTSVLVLLALLLMPDIQMVYLPIIALLGALSLIGRHGAPNRTFRLAPALGGAVLALAAASIFLLPLTATIATIVTPLLLAYAIVKREYVVGRALLAARLITSSLIAALLTVTVLVTGNTHAVSMLSLSTTTQSLDIKHIPLVFLTMLVVAFFEEFIGRAFIPYVGAGLTTHIFTTLHIPKLTAILCLLTEYTSSPLFNTLMVMGAGLCIATVATVLVATWRRAGLLGSVIAHALYNTTLIMIAGGQYTPAIILTTILATTQYILSKKET